MDVTKILCWSCNERGRYKEQWDSYLCPKCNKWITEPCTDEECFYCKNRPITPKET